MLLRWAALLIVPIASAAPPEWLPRLEQAALLETPMMRADTLFSAAELVADGPTRLRLVQQGLLAVSAARAEEARGFYMAAAAELLADVDPALALRFATDAPLRQAAAWQADYRGRAFSFLIRRRPELIEEALRAGAFHIPAAAERPELFPLLLANFPRQRARLQDVELLLRAAEAVAPALAIEAVTVALEAKGTPEDYESAWIGDVKLAGGMRQAMRIRIVQHVRHYLPDQWSRWAAEFGELASVPAERPAIRIEKTESFDLEERLLAKGPNGEYLDAVMRGACVATDFVRHRECAAAAARAAEVFSRQGA
ncbi:MAG: hypothetical protein B7X34_11150, partial [Acidobacteriia bacterium 12-62-4]